MPYTDQQLYDWFRNADYKRAGDFITSLIHCYSVADEHNRIILRPAVEQVMTKYPEYFSSDHD